MSIKVAIRHQTEYVFDRAVEVHPHVVRLRPAPHSRTPIESYALNIEPADHFINWQQDPFGNYLARLVFPEPTRSLRIDVEVIADLIVINPFDFFLEESAEQFPFRYEQALRRDLAPYLKVEERGEQLMAWLSEVPKKKSPLVPFLVALNQRLQQDIRYEIRMEPGVQTCEETLTRKIGSCRDSAWLLVQIFRHLRLAARFVSGYLVQLKSDQEALDGPSGPSQDFTDLHAWAEVYLPGAGWVGLDPTSGLFAGEGHIPLACTPSPSSAAPIAGATGVCNSKLNFTNDVTRILEDPRVTLPYSEDEWQRVDQLGQEVDRILDANDVRLTMGGEPTFVSIDDMEGAEWNNAAHGEEKRRLSGELFQRLKTQLAPEGMAHYGQGKWYPGEPLPRWALTLFWRKDGKPVWSAPELLADPQESGDHSTKDAQRLLSAVTEALGLPARRMLKAFENSGYYLWKESALPKGATPDNSRLKDPLERARVAKVFAQGLARPSGVLLPLKFTDDGKGGYWQTSGWPLRTRHVLLIPGDSPMGLRLPLESLPWKQDDDYQPDLDPFADLAPLRGRRHKITAEVSREVVHTALCVEAREGRLHVFMPPVSSVDAYLELLGLIEQVASAMACPIVLEGYEPPFDLRLTTLKITPDPGVIEVNVQPSASWPALVKNAHMLYEQARKARLGTEKFMLDGRHTGTGGGNHLTLGAAKPADSPFLRRPQLLQSLITFWQNHPSLSYLFSGLFIGPTSQAPRVDEARQEVLDELEIAFAQLPKGDSEQPWLVDRALRNFLVDLTGNTHRAEICIDKLYSPDSATGRLGIVEFRGFEMPPHPHMSLVQMLLVRALVAVFWQKPYQGNLIRWGSALHDRFMLGHYVWQDFSDVIAFLKANGLAFEADWFKAFREFRFPRIGTLNAAGMRVILHTGLEPWHVLGEESSQQGTSRYVDSSLERIQVSVDGFQPGRFAVLCNGQRLPLRPTRQDGVYVAGVRYKAWAPSSALHPTIPVHAPLKVDVVDLLNRRSVGGCIYHVAHPGGRNYDTFPVNANEAEARRFARFLSYGATRGRVEIPRESPLQAQSYSLDLRRFKSG